MKRILIAVALLAAGCGGDDDAPVDAGGGMDAPATPDAGDGEDAGEIREDAARDSSTARPTPRGALAEAGFVVADGSFEELDLSDCCAAGRTCSGNNPSSPYLATFLPRAPGQTVANFQERGDGLAAAVRMRSDEAFVMFGRTPPEAAYFGWTPYLFDREYGAMRRVPFASIDETLNDDTIRVDAAPGESPFDREFAWIAAADATTEATARAALIAAGIPERAISTIPIDPAIVRFGIEGPADTVGVLFRVALFTDDVAGEAYVDAPPVTVFRITPSTMGTPDPIASPTPRPEDLTDSETALEPAVDRLEAAILAAHPTYMIARDLMVTDGAVDPAACIADGSPCFGDNRDTIYPAAGPFVLGPTDMLYVLGVNHAATEKATYSSVSVYAIDHLVGVAAVTSREWTGSAETFLPGDPDAPSLFAWRIARDCGSETQCLQIENGMCPDGVAPAGLMALAFRAYVEPGTATAADPSTLVRERALLLRLR